MLPLTIVEYLHVLLAFVFVGSTLATHWNTIAARKATSWAERATHFELNRRVSLVFGLPSLIGAGIVGNLYAMQLGYRMSDTRLMQIVTALWLLAIVVALVLDVPLSARLAALSRSAANGSNGGEPVEWGGTLTRWRAGNAVLLALFFVLLWFMVSAWRS